VRDTLVVTHGNYVRRTELQRELLSRNVCCAPRYGQRSDPQTQVTDKLMIASVGSRIVGSSRHFARHPSANHVHDQSSRSAVAESSLSGNGDRLFQHNLSLAAACIMGHSYNSDLS